MTELLERAIAQLKIRPVEQQDAIARMILEELEEEANGINPLLVLLIY